MVDLTFTDSNSANGQAPGDTKRSQSGELQFCKMASFLNGTFLNCFHLFTYQRYMEFKEDAERKISGLEEAMATQQNQVC